MQEYLKKCSEAYYNGNPIITDEQFDNLVDSYGFNEVGAKPAGKTGKHIYPMYSLDKYYADEGEAPLLEYTTICTVKLDGAALDITYVDQKLYRVLTRGDGKEGQDVTDKFINSSLVPQTIPLTGVVQVTGEFVAPKTVENSRNYAAGALNLKDISEFNTRTVSFVAYGIYPYQTNSYHRDMLRLNAYGFTTILSIEQEDYPTDGKVIRIDSYAEFEALGYTSKFPRGAYALKVRGVAVETSLLAVEWQVGKSGKVTPVAILEPVLVGDALVSRATLNNGAFIQALGLYIGCTVGIVRAGEIIPQVLYAN